MFTGDKSAYPVYLTIGNISKHIRRQPSQRSQILIAYLPTMKIDKAMYTESDIRTLNAQLFHKAMSIVLQNMKGAARSGVMMADSEGDGRKCYPILAAYVADYPEQCVVAAVRQGQACPKSTTVKDQFGNNLYKAARDSKKTLAEIEKALRQPTAMLKNAVLKKAGLISVPELFWKDWDHVNIHTAITSDILHQLIQGMGKHLVSWLTPLVGEKEMDARFSRIPRAYGLRHFHSGISMLARVSGAEHKAIFAQLLGTVAGSIPSKAVRAARAMLDFIYLAQYECHTDSSLEVLKSQLDNFHKDKKVFLDYKTRKGT
jgi:hypothetical protein